MVTLILAGKGLPFCNFIHLHKNFILSITEKIK